MCNIQSSYSHTYMYTAMYTHLTYSRLLFARAKKKRSAYNDIRLFFFTIIAYRSWKYIHLSHQTDCVIEQEREQTRTCDKAFICVVMRSITLSISNMPAANPQPTHTHAAPPQRQHFLSSVYKAHLRVDGLKR